MVPEDCMFNLEIDAPMPKSTKSSAALVDCSNLIVNIVFPPFFILPLIGYYIMNFMSRGL